MTKILVVDDEEDLELLVRHKFNRKIKDNTYQFIFARDGVDALEKIKANTDLDIVLADINMPVMDGLTLLSHLPQVNPTLKTVIVSAYDDMKNIRIAMNLGAFDFVCKPIDFDDLDVTIEKTMSHVKQLRQMQYLTSTLNDIAYQQSHLIRRPLANIIGLLNLLDYPDDLTESGQGVVEMLKQSCNELNNEFDDFMTKGVPNELPPKVG